MHVAMAVISLTWITVLQLELLYLNNLILFVFFATVVGYNFVKYFGVAKTHHRRLTGSLHSIQWFTILALVAMCYFGLRLGFNTLVVLGVLALITFLYAIPILPMRLFRDQQKNLREISGLKIYLIALVWTLTTVVLPVVESGIDLSSDILILGVQRFVFVIVLMLPFEIRDLNYDSLKLATIPQKIGIRKTKIIGVVLMLLFFLSDYFKDELDGNSIITTCIVVFFTVLFLIFSKKKQSKYYTAFWIEGLPIFWLFVLLVFR